MEQQNVFSSVKNILGGPGLPRWIKGQYVRRPVPTSDGYEVHYCLVGALSEILDEPSANFKEAVAMIREHINREEPFSLSLWNDQPNRTSDEVEKVLDGLIEKHG